MLFGIWSMKFFHTLLEVKWYLTQFTVSQCDTCVSYSLEQCVIFINYIYLMLLYILHPFMVFTRQLIMCCIYAYYVCCIW